MEDINNHGSELSNKALYCTSKVVWYVIGYLSCTVSSPTFHKVVYGPGQVSGQSWKLVLQRI